MARIVAFGECMVELGVGDEPAAAIGYAGDTFNTAVYLSRLGHSVSYATAIGRDDPFSQGILDKMDAEGIDRRLVVAAAGRLPGLYSIQRDAAGERSFYYWRGEAPVRDYFQLANAGDLGLAMGRTDLVYLSGISLSVVGEAGRAALLPLLTRARAAGVAIAFDPNFRARLWDDYDTARRAMEAVIRLCRYVSVSSDDAKALYPGRPVDATARQWAAEGAEVIERAGDLSVRLHMAEGTQVLAPAQAVAATDTTGAGDAFNAAYLSARLNGEPPRPAVEAGRLLAGVVVQHPGAILPIEAMPKLG